MPSILDIQTVIMRAELQKLLHKLEDLKYRIPIDPIPEPYPDPPGQLVGQIDYAGDVLLADLYKSHVMSGDPDGAPAEAIRRVLQGMFDVYSDAAVRMQDELRQYSRERVGK